MEPSDATPLQTSAAMPAPTAQPVAPTMSLPAAPPQQAQDTDTIEAEWVSIVKQIIAHNRHDPYQLSQAMTALRKDYLQKRYGEQIKSAE